MRNQNDGQSSQIAGDDREPALAKHWLNIQIDLLRRFTSDLCARWTYRGAAEVTGVSKEGLRKFVDGETRPNLATRQALGELFLKLYPSGVMETKTDGEWQLRKQLIELLPEGEREARAELARIFELAKRFPDEVPPCAEAVLDWMDLQVRGEYWGVRYVYGSAARERQRKGEAKRPRAKKKSEAASEDAQEE
jgi:hypothetical protein